MGGLTAVILSACFSLGAMHFKQQEICYRELNKCFAKVQESHPQLSIDATLTHCIMERDWLTVGSKTSP